MMKPILSLLAVCFILGVVASAFGDKPITTDVVAAGEKNIPQEKVQMKLKVFGGNGEVVFLLNDSQAAKDLYAQLPLKIKVENYADNEKIFYPPKKLQTFSTPLANAKAGTLAYYAPWGNVVMFYQNFGSFAGLYVLGEAISGSDKISALSGDFSVQIEK